MAKVKNVSNQPLYLNLPGARSVKVPARSLAEIDESDLNSPAVSFHLGAGTMIVVEREEV